MRKIVIGALVLLAVASVSWAQDKPAEKPKVETPVVSVEDGLKLNNAILQVENITLKIQAMQATLQQAQDAAQKVVASLQKPGYTLQRGEKGEFIYVVDAPKAEKK